jgi:hypothetical protein
VKSSGLQSGSKATPPPSPAAELAPPLPPAVPGATGGDSGGAAPGERVAPIGVFVAVPIVGAGMPIAGGSGVPILASSAGPIVGGNEVPVPIVGLSEVPMVGGSEVPIVGFNGVPIVGFNEPPIVGASEVPIVGSVPSGGNGEGVSMGVGAEVPTVELLVRGLVAPIAANLDVPMASGSNIPKPVLAGPDAVEPSVPISRCVAFADVPGAAGSRVLAAIPPNVLCPRTGAIVKMAAATANPAAKL